MRNNTRQIYDLLSRGAFLAADSIDAQTKHLYNDVEENFEDYAAYYAELGLRLEAGDGYYYFARERESKATIEQKLQTLATWVDILDFVKTFDVTFGAGFQFRSAQILERMNVDTDLRQKGAKLFRKQNTHQEVVEKLVSELTGMGLAEVVNEQDGTCKVTAAFRYMEELVNLINLYNEEETPEQ